MTTTHTPSVAPRKFAILAVTLAWACAGHAAPTPDPAPFTEGFEASNSLATAAVQGQAAVRRGDAFKGTACLFLTRTKADMEKQRTEVVLPSFPVREGLWDLGATLRSRLYSPDSSYNGTVRVEVLDATGKALDRIELAIATGDSPWLARRKRIEMPSGSSSARFILSMEKTYGEFAVDELRAIHAGPSLRTVRAIKFASEAVGNLFLPEQALRFEVTAECTQPRPESERVATCVVRDYWGAEFTAPLRVELAAAGTTTTGRLSYRGTFNLDGQGLETGKYYEIHAEMSEAALPEPARDTSSFAVLPLAVTKQHKPFDVPFTASGWNPGVPGFFPLCDRLGLRVANVYSRWKAEPPYACSAPGIEIVKQLGMGALMSTPVAAVERSGASPYDETALREGARRMVAEFSRQLPIAVRVGNEPHPVDDADAQRMIKAYKAVFEGVKAADTSVVVTATSCGSEDEFFRNNYQPWHDVFDFHAYADHQSVSGAFAEYDRLVAKYGQRKPVWSTEIGLNSEGMARSAVAIEMIKIFANFFAYGGANVSWFGIMWPDPTGSIVGSNGDSFDVFNSKYCLYSPKLTAISEYYMVNSICIKKVVGQKTYPGAVSLTLFRDADNRCLLVAWKDGGREDVFLPLPGVASVRAVRIDGGSSAFDAGGRGLTLGLSDEPYLLEFTSADLQLPAALGPPRATCEGAITPVVKGGTVPLVVRCDGVAPDVIELVAPPRWTVRREITSAAGVARFTVSAPTPTAATVGRLLARVGMAGEILIPVPVVDPLEVRFQPVAITEGGAGMGLRLTNRGSSPQQAHWKVTLPEVFPMANGTFKLGDPQPFSPALTTPAEGEQTLAPGAFADLVIRAGNLDPHSLYRARLELVVDGRTLSQERLFGGCPGVPKVAGGGVIFDGKLGAPAWQRAAVVTLDQEGQFAALNGKTAGWDGPGDLSGTMRLLWDDQYLYVGMRVRDDIFSQPKEDSGLWCGDGLQFLVDPCRSLADKPGKYDYAVSLTRKGPQAWCYFTADATRAPSGEAKDFILKITPTGERGDRVYELAIPWRRLSPFVPGPGANLGLAMIINEDDGKIRDSFMSWFGCAHSKQMSMNGDLILLGERDDRSPWGIASGAEWSGDYPAFNPMLHEAGVRWLRFFPEWQTIQPRQGEWVWDSADRLVANARTNDIHITGIFCFFAKWASADGGTRKCPVKDMQYWRDYVRESVARYRKDIKYWEVWNEFNGSFAVNGTPKIYADMTRAAFESARSADPSAQIGISCANFDVGWLDAVIKAGAADHFDYVCVHPYENLGAAMQGGESGYLSLAASLRAMLAANKQRVDIPLWITETGHQSTILPNAQADALQAEALAKVYILSIAQGFQRVCWFEARGPAYGHGTDHGIIRKDWSKRPAYDTLKTMTRLLGAEPRYQGWLKTGATGYGFVFEGGASPVLATWSPAEATNTVTFGAPVRVVDLAGNETALAAGRPLTLTRTPVFIASLPDDQVTLARSQADAPFPWGTDYSQSREASCRLGALNAEKGIKQTRPETTAVENGLTESCRRTAFNIGGEGRYIYFRVDPTFAPFGTTNLEITVEARRIATDKPASMGLLYESLKGYRGAQGHFNIPADEAWHTYTWKVSNANFVGGWGWNFRTEATGSANEFLVRDVRVRKGGAEVTP